MKPKAALMMLSLTSSLALTAHGAEGFTPDFSVAAKAVPLIRLALNDEERMLLRRQWQNLPPDERERLRRRLREEHPDPRDEGFGQGFEMRRPGDDGFRADPDRSWGQGQPGDRMREIRKNRR
jgi:hypothetical protein